MSDHPPDSTEPGEAATWPTADAALAAAPPPTADRSRIPTYPVLVRLTHWLVTVAIVLLIGSGLQIFNAHPTLYASDASDGRRVVLSLPEPAGQDGLGRPVFQMTVLGRVVSVGHVDFQAFPPALTVGGWLAGGRRVHFTMAWVLVACGLVYGLYMLASPRKRAVWLQRDEWRQLLPALRAHLKFPPVLVGAHGRLNPLQKLAYTAVPVVLVPFIIATGLALSPQWDAIVPFWSDLFGGRQFARTWHFVGMALLIGFMASHVLLVALSGWGTFMHMITGRVAPTPEARSHHEAP